MGFGKGLGFKRFPPLPKARDPRGLDEMELFRMNLPIPVPNSKGLDAQR